MSKRNRSADQILAYLALHPASDRAEVAASLHMPASTVRRNVAQLVNRGLVKEGLTPCPEAGEPLDRYFIAIVTKYESHDLDDAKRDLSIPYQQHLEQQIRKALQAPKYLGKLTLVSLDITLGTDWDILLVVTARDKAIVGDFITKFLRSRPHVHQTRTGTAYYSPVESPAPAASKPSRRGSKAN